MSIEEILKEADAMAPEDLARLVDSLLVLMRKPDPSAEKAWEEEIDRRMDDYEQGRDVFVSGDQVLERLRRHRRTE